VFTLFKRSFAAACVSIAVLVGVAPAASATPRPHHHKMVKAIDWDAPSPSAPSVGVNRAIDWD